jgi:hypothetical protein
MKPIQAWTLTRCELSPKASTNFTIRTKRDSSLRTIKVAQLHRPDFVHVLSGGRIVKEGGKELALELEEKGYDWLKNENGKSAHRRAN